MRMIEACFAKIVLFDLGNKDAPAPTLLELADDVSTEETVPARDDDAFILEKIADSEPPEDFLGFPLELEGEDLSFSASTIRRTRLLKSVFGCQPNASRAFEESPRRRSTSVGRR